MSTTRVALVTGARRGIGRAIALCLARDGYDIVVNDYAIDALGEQTATDIRALGRQAHLIAADLGDTASIKALVQQTVEHFGRIDVLVNNAATWEWDDFVDVPEAKEVVNKISLSEDPEEIKQGIYRLQTLGAETVSVIPIARTPGIWIINKKVKGGMNPVYALWTRNDWQWENITVEA